MFASSCEYAQEIASGSKLSACCCKLFQVVSSFDMCGCLEISYVFNILIHRHFADISWFEVACVVIIYPQAFSSFYSCLIWHCSNKVLQISRKWALDVVILDGGKVFCCHYLISIKFLVYIV